MKKFIAVISVFTVFALLFFSLPWSRPPGRAQESQAVSKIGGRLARDLRVKEARLHRADQGQPQDGSKNALDNVPVKDPTTQQLFIYFEKRPTRSQLGELEALGITPYPD